MALRNILEFGDKTLNKVCRPVKDFNKRLHILLDDMKDTLLDAEGLGLAAPQVGVLRRVVVVIDINKEAEYEEDKIIELVNPEIIYTEGEQEGMEGCLSLPGEFGIVKRPNIVKVRAFDRYGQEFEYTGEGLTARCFCHELDHLDGHLYTERASRMLTPEELDEMRGDAE
ncbi:MAG: peptide deformylase [Ruminococcaceae bacterium]|nr:peptide deformylase [Oscillospiraceae bacterium]